ncbi:MULTISPECIES: hypothetical protein [Catenuloplanes]|uniref:Uncharacterized protein n=1 Tax=Catenuloplanes niger TaxID=587534 RepID=A0AAE3ZVU1_9ACTN|nr:hypothetical protein [Catenuloplanes niger]MDR7326746.1 hypothetical protein [Catenuloplanes niger]
MTRNIRMTAGLAAVLVPAAALLAVGTFLTGSYHDLGVVLAGTHWDGVIPAVLAGTHWDGLVPAVLAGTHWDGLVPAVLTGTNWDALIPLSRGGGQTLAPGLADISWGALGGKDWTAAGLAGLHEAR